MAATTAGAVKAYVETLGLGVSVYRDTAPKDATLPYVTVQERVSMTPDASGDNGAGATAAEQIQVDVWQRWRNPSTNAVEESYTLADAVARGLHGASLPVVGDRHVYGARFDFAVRIVEHDTNVVHDALTVTVRREL